MLLPPNSCRPPTSSSRPEEIIYVTSEAFLRELRPGQRFVRISSVRNCGPTSYLRPAKISSSVAVMISIYDLIHFCDVFWATPCMPCASYSFANLSIGPTVCSAPNIMGAYRGKISTRPTRDTPPRLMAAQYRTSFKASPSCVVSIVVDLEDVRIFDGMFSLILLSILNCDVPCVSN